MASPLPIKRLSRDWITAKGPDALRFLNGMWTCDFKRALSAPVGFCGSGAGLLLNVKGKPVAYGIFLALGAEEFLISVPAGSGEGAVKALEHLLVADDVELRLNLAAEAPWAVVAIPDGLPGQEKLPELPAIAPDAKDRVFAAQREAVGWRVPRFQLGPRHEEMWLFDGAQLPIASVELRDDEWLGRRIQAGVPEWNVDYDAESLVLELPFHDEISFHKGCYIGQEVVARGTYRGRMNRGFARFTAEAALRPGFLHSESDPTKAVAKITSVLGERALGLVRLAALEPDAEGRAPGRLFQPDLQGAVLVRSVEIIP